MRLLDVISPVEELGGFFAENWPYIAIAVAVLVAVIIIIKRAVNKKKEK